MKFKDIKKLPFATYKVNVPWTSLENTLEKYNESHTLILDPPYQRGTGTKNTHSKGRVWVHKGNITKMILQEELEIYLKNNYVLGRNVSTTKNKVAINKNNKNYFIEPSKLDDYLKNGYSKGFYKK